MDPLPADNQNRANRVFYLVSAIIVIISIYLIASAIVISQTTGSLHISSSDSRATLSISRSDTQAKAIGVGKANVRLKPGSYLVAASNNGKETTAVVRVYKKQTTTNSLDLANAALLPSAENINLAGEDSLINRGLTLAQIHALKQALFKYKPAVQSVSIIPSSIEPGPHDPNSADRTFKINFSVNIDSAEYKATISYSNLDSIDLYLYNLDSGSLVYDSGVVGP